MTDTPSERVEQAREALDSLVQFAYETGFHELGYGPVDALIAAACAEERARLANAPVVQKLRDALSGEGDDYPLPVDMDGNVCVLVFNEGLYELALDSSHLRALLALLTNREGA